MKTVNYITILALSILLSIKLSAQDHQPHQFSVWGAGGLSTLDYKTKVGSQKNGIGGQFGVGYTYFINQNIGFGTGLELAFYKAKTKLDNYSDAHMIKDIDGQDIEFRTKIEGYEDKQNATMLNIPIMAQYQTTGTYKFYGAAGMKIGIPVSAKSKVHTAKNINTGYIGGDEDWEYVEQEFMGFGTFTNRNSKEDLKLKVACMLSLEAGMKWAITSGSNLFAAVYFDYGLNNINKNAGTTALVGYNTQSPKDFINNSVMTSIQTANGKAENIVDKVKPMAVGLKIGFTFGM